MLVINRKPGEEIVIYTPDGKELGRIRLCKKDAPSGRASIGLTLPEEYRVMRAEFVEQQEDRR